MKKDFETQLNQKGFSLVEIIVSLAIFSLIITGITLFGVRTIDARTKSQAMQNAIQNARFLTEKINKRIRTSYNVDGAGDMNGGDSVFIVDNVNEYRYCYKFDSTDKALKVASADNLSDYDECGDFSISDFKDLIGGVDGVDDIQVEGKFYVKKTDVGAGSRGFVRTTIKITYNYSGDYKERDEVLIQSGVSLRDY